MTTYYFVLILILIIIIFYQQSKIKKMKKVIKDMKVNNEKNLNKVDDLEKELMETHKDLKHSLYSINELKMNTVNLEDHLNEVEAQQHTKNKNAKKIMQEAKKVELHNEVKNTPRIEKSQSDISKQLLVMKIELIQKVEFYNDKIEEINLIENLEERKQEQQKILNELLEIKKLVKDYQKLEKDILDEILIAKIEEYKVEA